MGDPKEYLLVVDDEPEVLEFLAEELAAEGRDVLTACSAEDALENFLKPEAFEQRPLDFLLSDFQMSGLSGLELLLGLNFRYKDLGFAFLTGYAQRFRMLVAMNYGAFDFVEKPYDVATTQKMVDSGIRRSKWTKKIHTEVDRLAKDFRLFPNTKARFERKARFVLRLEDEGFDLNQMHEWFERGAHSSEGGFAEAVSQLQMLFIHSAGKRCTDAAVGFEGASLEDKLQILRRCYLSCRDMKFAAVSLGLEELANTFGWLSECSLEMRVLPSAMNSANESLLSESLRSLSIELQKIDAVKDSHDWGLGGKVERLQLLHDQSVSKLFTI